MLPRSPCRLHRALTGPTRSSICSGNGRHIELTFRDWKAHLGIRGLRLEADIAPRLGRLLIALSTAYVLAVLSLGSTHRFRLLQPRTTEPHDSENVWLGIISPMGTASRRRRFWPDCTLSIVWSTPRDPATEWADIVTEHSRGTSFMVLPDTTIGGCVTSRKAL